MYETRSAGLIKIPAQAQASRAARTRARVAGRGGYIFLYDLLYLFLLIR